MIENRAFGTEIEWGLMVVPTFHYRVDEQGRPQYQLIADDDVGRLIRDCLPKSPEGLPDHLPKHLGRISYMLSNGGKAYADHGHPEYCTPEVTTLDDLVASEIAGERIIFQIFKNAVARGNIIRDFALNKRVIDDKNSSWGYHENYQVDRRYIDIKKRHGKEGEAAKHAEAFDLLLDHFATRTIYCGAGGIRQGRFVVGQKTSVVTHEFSLDTVNEKPLINTRDEVHGDIDKYARLHVPAVDPHMSPWGTRMSVGPTDLILSMLECGYQPDDTTLRLAPNTRHSVARAVATDPTCRETFRTTSGLYVTANTIQQNLLEQVKKWAKGRELSNDQQWVLEEWERTLSDIEQNPMLLKNRAEWVYRKLAHDKYRNGQLQEDMKKTRRTANELLHERDVQWDRIGTPGSIGTLLRGRLWGDWMPDEALVQERMVLPPNTRAKLRKAFIDRFENHRYAALHWDVATPPSIFPDAPRIELPDPRSPHNAELEALLAKPIVTLGSQR